MRRIRPSAILYGLAVVLALVAIQQTTGWLK